MQNDVAAAGCLRDQENKRYEELEAKLQGVEAQLMKAYEDAADAHRSTGAACSVSSYFPYVCTRQMEATSQARDSAESRLATLSKEIDAVKQAHSVQISQVRPGYVMRFLV